ncbi:alkaline phosphatase family protein [Methylohalomonas lacus]|uniref:alkaline phosphatase family protein n=1 Tax=Methylohalomonas lacus TaxID=398773 RepID=UPI00216A32B7|nr:alkaline phosphatase family protein [Methylohalomonas lacus]
MAPLTFFYGNRAEFDFALDDVLVPLATIFITAAVILYLFLWLAQQGGWRKKHFLSALLVALGGCAFIQSQILVWEFGPLDGRGVDWDGRYIEQIIEVCVWSLILLGTFVFSRKYTNLPYNFATVLVLAGVLSIGGTWFTSSKGHTTEYVSTRANVLHPENNTILIVLDTFQSGAFSQILERYPKDARAFDGFVFYPNAVAGFPTTYPSIPYILTGRQYQNKEPIEKFAMSSYAAKGLPKYFYEAEYGQSYSALVPKSLNGIEEYNAEVQSKGGILRGQDTKEGIHAFVQLVDAGLFRVMPTSLKPFIYNEGAWLISHWLVSSLPPTQHRVDIRFIDWLTSNLVTKSDNRGEFRLYHFFGAHLPLVMDENHRYQPNLDLSWDNYVQQARGSLKMVSRLLESLKKNKVYNNANIMVISDHGTMTFAPRESRCEDEWGCDINENRHASGMPLFLYKPANSQGAIRVTDEAVSLGDISCLLSIEYKLDDCERSKSVRAGERYFYWYNWGHEYWGKKYMPPLTEYRVDGHAHDASAWQETGRVFTREGIKHVDLLPNVRNGEKISLVNADSNVYVAFGWSPSEGSHRWTDGGVAGIEFEISRIRGDEDIAFQLAAAPYLAQGKIEEQQVEVIANGYKLDTWAISKKGIFDVRIPAKAIGEKGHVQLSLNISNPAAPSSFGHSNDNRNLGLAAHWFRLRDLENRSVSR